MLHAGSSASVRRGTPGPLVGEHGVVTAGPIGSFQLLYSERVATMGCLLVVV